MRILLTLVLALLCGTAQSAFFNNDFTTNAFHSATPVVVLDNAGIPLGLGTTSTNAFLMRRSTGFAFVDAGTNGMVGGGPFTVNTLPKATATNALGDSSIKDSGGIISSTNNTLLLGSTNNLQDAVIIQPNTNVDVSGSSFTISGGASAGSGGDINLLGHDATAGDTAGGSILITSGLGSGLGTAGNIQFNSKDTLLMQAVGDISAFAPNFRPSFDNAMGLGTAAKAWGSNYIGTKLFIGTNQYTDNGTSLLRNGSAVGGGAAGITNSGLTLNTVVKATGTNSVGNASFTDNGTAVTMTEPLLFSADNTLDIGATNATRPRDIYVGRQVLAAQGTNSQPSLSFASATNVGLYVQATGGSGSLGFAAPSSYGWRRSDGTDVLFLSANGIRSRSDANIAWYNNTTPVLGGGAEDLTLSREAAAILQLGQDSATPVAQTLKGPDGSGSNIPATNFTVAPGRGTGTGIGGTFYIATAGPGSTGSSQNVLTNRLSVDAQGSVAVSNFNGTATALVGSSASNTLSAVTLGAGLTLTSGTLSATAFTTAVTTLTYTGTTNAAGFNAATNGQTFILLVTNNVFFGTATFSNLPATSANQFYTLGLQMDTTGGYTVGFTNSVVGWADGFAPVIKTNAGAVSYLYFHTHLFTNSMLVGVPNLNIQ